MFIKTVILEGFKSYRDKTNIGPFDRHFNAITGYNGSGKSNILDAICFVLGLTSLSTVRATCLGDLIYKGATNRRASVSIVFDNTDKGKGRSPLGYDKYDEIIISRTVENAELCKYFLNGLSSTKRDVAEMLGSVQLNINQPNFVIMQGKITKVVNMKPKEFLFMIEETVGATAYQAKRDKTQKELNDKERQLDNIRETMNEIIFPALNKQKKALADIEEYNLLTNEHTRKRRAYHAAVYKEKKVELESRNKALEEVLSADSADEAKQKSYEEEIKDCKTRQNDMQKEATNFDAKISAAEKEMNVYKKKMLLSEAELNSAKQNEQEARENVKEKEAARDDEKKQMDQFQTKGKSLIEEFNKVKLEVDTAEKNLNDARKLESELKMGAIVDEFGNAMNAIKQQQDVDEKVLRLQTDIEMNEMDQKRLAERLSVAECQLRKAPAHKDIETRYNTAVEKMEHFKRETARENFNMETPKDWQRLFSELNQKLGQLEKRKQNIFRQYPELNFYYKEDPRKADPEKIKGQVYNLIKFKDIATWGTAFEVAAKGFLLHVVVDEASVAKYLVQPGVLPNRMTIHPMDVFKSNSQNNITQKMLDSKLGKGVATRLLDLVEYDPKYHDLVQSHIGHKVLVETSADARKVAFGHHFFSIAKNGDSVDPDGIMQGGARKNGGAWIKAADDVRVLNEEITCVQHEQQILKREQEFLFAYRDVSYELETATNLRNQIPRFVAMNEIAEIKKKNETISEQNMSWKKEKQQLEKEAAKLKSKVDNLDTIRAKHYEENKLNIQKYEKALEIAQKNYNARQAVYYNVDVDIKSREQLILDCQKDVDKAQSELDEYLKDTNSKLEAVEAARELFNSKQKIYDAEVGGNKKWRVEKQRLENAITKAKEKLHETEMSKMRRDNDRKELCSTVNAIRKKLEDLEASNPEIDFTNLPPGGRNENAQKMKEEVDFLAFRMITMKERLDFEGAEKMNITKMKIREAEKKLKQVSSNRNKLQEAVKQLDKHKMDLVSAAYGRINKEFDSMMSTLLPESHARLVPVNPRDLTAGLNIHVCLGGVWKESLTELSGGQRSLVALALVLSLCMYNPAPFYVLDEIDAALDMNHTQNMGRLIRERFQKTQFICVSLKNGMYTNANVVFQASFVHGSSEVRRCTKKINSSSTPRVVVVAPQDGVQRDQERPGPSWKKY